MRLTLIVACVCCCVVLLGVFLLLFVFRGLCLGFLVIAVVVVIGFVCIVALLVGAC